MRKLITSILIVLILSMSSIGIANVFSSSNSHNEKTSTQMRSNGYGIQWMLEYGSSVDRRTI